MVFMGHSGSSAIMSELREHSQTFMEDAELVDHQPVFNSTAALEITRAFFERGAKVGKVPGFKIRPMHILNLPKEFAALARQYDTRIIWQYRKNVFKAAVGEYANRYLNDSLAVEGLRTNISMEERCKSGVCSFRIDNVTFLHKMMQSKMRSHHRILDAVNGISADSDCVREIPYEDYLHDRKAVMTDIQLFLGLRAEVTKPLRFKATKDRMCDVVENWDDVCRQLYGCLVWQPMLDDARNNCFCNFTTGPIRYCNIGL